MESVGYLDSSRLKKRGVFCGTTLIPQDSPATVISPKFLHILEYKYCTKNALLTACAGKATPLKCYLVV